MKRLEYIILLSLFFTSYSFSQKFDAQIAIGFNASQIDGDLYSGYSKLGIHAGLQLEYDLNTTWKIGTGLFYNELGSQKKLQIGSSNPEEQQKIQLAYIFFPLELILSPQSSNEVLSKFRFTGGLHSGYLIKSQIRNQSDEPILEFFNNLDFAASLGVDYLLNDFWSVSLRARESFTLLFNNNKIDAINANSLRNKYLTFSVNRKL